MASDQHSRQQERIEQRALERDLVSLLSPHEATQDKAEAQAVRLRDLLTRIKVRNAEA